MHSSWDYSKSQKARRIGLLLVLVALLLATPVGNIAVAQDGNGASIHVVAWGETLTAIAARYGVAVDSIMTANNLAAPDRIYAGQHLIIPSEQGTALSSGSRPAQHVVQAGENLFRIGLRYGLSVEELMVANNLADGGQVYAGQTLAIPAPGGVARAAQAQAPSAPQDGTHEVQPGETLSSISRRYDVSIAALTAANNLVNPSAIYAGQRLVLPGAAAAGSSPGYTPSESGTSHTVQPGETLFSIATRHGTTVSVLAQVNHISTPSLLYSGQVLTIPAPGALAQVAPQAAGTAKSIVVDISDQRAYVYEDGGLKWTFVISSGMPGRETRRGNFQIQNKIPNAYASTWDLQMPYWLGFYWAGPLQNGFHALPILSSGVRLWEGLLGRPASYGCIILSDHDARLLYDWAEVGTPVTVRD